MAKANAPVFVDISIYLRDKNFTLFGAITPPEPSQMDPQHQFFKRPEPER